MAGRAEDIDLEPDAEPVREFTGVPEAPDRGRLRVDETAVRHMAEQAAAEVTGRTASRHGISALGSGQSLPRATATVIGRHARIEVHVSVPDGRSLPVWAKLTRQHVTERVSALSGLIVDVTDVRVVGMGMPHIGDDSSGLPAAPRPAGPGPARFAGVVLALVVVATGLAAMYDALVKLDGLAGDSIIDAVVDWLDGLRPETWMLAAGTGVALIGLWFLLAGLWRRPRRSLPVASDTGVYASRSAVEGLAADTAARHPGVVKVRAKARATAVVVRVDTDGEATAEEEVRAGVRTRIARLSGPYDVRGSVRRAGIRS